MKSFLMSAPIIGLLMMFAPAPQPVATAHRGPKDETEASKTIDRLARAAIAKAGLKPNPICDDATFVRRAWLQLAGRIPSRAEAFRFLKSRETNKRQALIDQLLSSPAHTSHRFNQWADLLRAKSRLRGRLSGEPFIHFIKESLQENKPYDEMVSEMLTASGPAHARGNGATGYLMRDRGMPLDSLANTMRVFLGTRLECAQCHNHPFEQWTQMQFYQMAAFTGGLSYNQRNFKSFPDDLKSLAVSVRDFARSAGPLGKRAGRRMLQPLLQGIEGSGTGVVRLPKDYRYDDAKPGQVVKAATLFGDAAPVAYRETPRKKGRRRRPGKTRRGKRRKRAPQVDSRQAFAQWLCSPENPRFTKTIVNRIWARIMGRGLIAKVDDIREDSPVSNPELLLYLEELMVKLDYDLLAFEKAIVSTQLWQREASEEEGTQSRHAPLRGPLLRRMSAEQTWDSLLTLTIDDVDGTLRAPDARAEPIYAAQEQLLSLSQDELQEQFNAMLLRYKNPKEFKARRRQMARAKRNRGNAERERFRQKMKSLRRERSLARKRKDRQALRRIGREIKTLAAQAKSRRRQRGRRKGAPLVRASETTSPAPQRHLLRQFGQSDREQIDGAHHDATVPQVLNLLNGFSSRFIRQQNTQIMRDLDAAAGPQAKIRRAYLAMLSRVPNEQEIALWEKDLRENPGEAVEDLVWSLLNTQEFRFIR